MRGHLVYWGFWIGAESGGGEGEGRGEEGEEMGWEEVGWEEERDIAECSYIATV